jgi:hypothetical protein
MPKIKNKPSESARLLHRDGSEITIQQALTKIHSLRKAKAKDPELFKLNGGSHNLLLLYQHIQQAKREIIARRQNGSAF